MYIALYTMVYICILTAIVAMIQLQTRVHARSSLEEGRDLGLGVLFLNELCLLNTAFTVTRQRRTGHSWYREKPYWCQIHSCIINIIESVV